MITFSVSAEERDKRLSICQQCPERIEKSMATIKWYICAKCGCHLDAKSLMKWADCPLGKWPKDGGDNNLMSKGNNSESQV